MHDLESFFWVILWICIHYDGPNSSRVVPRFEKWNYVNMEELAGMKLGVVAKESIFLRSQRTILHPITGLSFHGLTIYEGRFPPWISRGRKRITVSMKGFGQSLAGHKGIH
ncbi:hypothetical protein BDV12DRAFT_163649 [Aspergillus spectabilis]